jgi:formate dehydrogenase major subunit
VETVCAHCGCGCHLVFNLKGEGFFTISTRSDAPPNYGHTCRRGRFDRFAYLSGPQRLKTPLLRKEGRLVESSWEEALECIARELSRLAERYGTQALAAVGSPQSTNEANYLLQKLFRTRFETNNLDCPDSRSHRTSMATLARTLGDGFEPGVLGEIENAELILAFGNTIEENNPIVAAALRRASRTRGRRLISAASEPPAFAPFARPAIHLPRGREADLLFALIHQSLQGGLFDPARVRALTPKLEQLEQAMAVRPLDRTLGPLALSPETLDDLAHALAAAGSLALVYSEDVADGPEGELTVQALATLALLAGRTGRPDSGIYPLCRHINTYGAADMGLQPDHLPGRIPISDDPACARLAAAWGQPLPRGVGLELAQMVEAARQGTLKGLYVLGADALPEDFAAGLRHVEFLAVQDLFLRRSAEYAHVVLPAQSFLEQEGTFTNTEGRVRRLRPVITGPDGTLPDWRVLSKLSARLTPGAGYPDARSVYREIAALVRYPAERF